MTSAMLRRTTMIFITLLLLMVDTVLIFLSRLASPTLTDLIDLTEPFL